MCMKVVRVDKCVTALGMGEGSISSRSIEAATSIALLCLVCYAVGFRIFLVATLVSVTLFTSHRQVDRWWPTTASISVLYRNNNNNNDINTQIKRLYEETESVISKDYTVTMDGSNKNIGRTKAEVHEGTVTSNTSVTARDSLPVDHSSWPALPGTAEVPVTRTD